ncbi:MAG: ATP-binding cassette domain-containing protein [Christensenellaceae bacterium]|jgi:spermidine/putrescine transport system ATP-binding protein|nr:ATP-binding cassette domain-containing protein [Christensenellaceae bacterium]
MTTDKIIELKNVSKSYDEKPVVSSVSLTIKKGEFVTFLGPSGCGKTTTLRMIAGFEKPTSGTIYISGKDMTTSPPYDRNVNTVFQNYALFPHLNVYNNIAFGLKLKSIPDGTFFVDKNGNKFENLRKLTKDEIAAKVKTALKMVDLEEYEKRNVSSLSGGQKQRVAIARSLVNEPDVLLLDEPLGALDLKMRKDMQIELMNMHKKLGITFLYVTHDQEEALTMSDTIVVMKDGIIQQIGTPQKVYDEPANAFVADFIGESNIFSGIMVTDFNVKFCDHSFECVDKGFKYNEPIDVIVRPEDVSILSSDDARAALLATISSCVFKGDHFQITAIIAGGEDYEMLIHDNVNCRPGDKVGLYIKPSDLHIMHKARIINEIVTEMWDTNTVEICGGKFPCQCDLPSGTKVKVSVDFDDVIIYDDENDGIIGGEIVNTIYKGNYYQCVVRTDTYYDFFADTEDEWLKGDRVGISVAPDKILITKLEETI